MNVLILAIATFVGVWFGAAAPSNSPVSPPAPPSSVPPEPAVAVPPTTRVVTTTL
jgi:hypothetical protein